MNCAKMNPETIKLCPQCYLQIREEWTVVSVIPVLSRSVLPAQQSWWLGWARVVYHFCTVKTQTGESKGLARVCVGVSVLVYPDPSTSIRISIS